MPFGQPSQFEKPPAPEDSKIKDWLEEKEVKDRLDKSQIQSVIEMAKTSVPKEILEADDSTLRMEQKRLKGLPYFSGSNLQELLNYEGKKEGFAFVNTKDIVGGISPAFEDWSTEYTRRKDRVITIAKSLCQPTEESVEEIFHFEDPDSQIKLKKISGPGGDLFFVVDGHHRVSGCKLARLPEVPAQIESMNELSEVYTFNRNLAFQWRERLESGLINGSIDEAKQKNGETRFTLKIENQALPWMHLPQWALIKFNKFYESQYPGALDKLKIPKGALLDTVGFNYYLAGRYEEYEKIKNKT